MTASTSRGRWPPPRASSERLVTSAAPRASPCAPWTCSVHSRCPSLCATILRPTAASPKATASICVRTSSSAAEATAGRVSCSASALPSSGSPSPGAPKLNESGTRSHSLSRHDSASSHDMPTSAGSVSRFLTR
eukprot:1588633-Prymnesium_polylepis.1